MIGIDNLLRAQKLIISEIKTGRCLVSLPMEADYIASLKHDDLIAVQSEMDEWEFQDPIAIEVQKSSNGAIRTAHYVPAIDRLVIMAALVDGYDALYNMVEPFNGAVNFDRPLPSNPDIDFMDVDYHQPYQAFKKQLRNQMADEKYLLHTDIRNFAGDVRRNQLIAQMEQGGFGPQSLSVIQRAFDCWSDNGIHGIVQGYGFTDLFLKMAMVPVDTVMTNEPSYQYSRYVDDIVVAATTQSEAVKALQTLTGSLAFQGLRVKKSATHLQHPNEAGHGHAYNIKRDMNRVSGDISVADILNGRKPHDADADDILRVAYHNFVDPDGPLIPKPKYLVSHILREMRIAKMPELARDAKKLMDFYPQRAKKILKSALDCDGRVVVGMADYFFNDRNMDDTTWDSRRLDYLAVMRERQYAIPPYEICVIHRSLKLISQRQPLFNAFRGEVDRQSKRVIGTPSKSLSPK